MAEPQKRCMFQMPQGENISLRDLVLAWWPALLVVVIGFGIAAMFIKPAPPDRVVIATGAEDGAYYFFAGQYADILASYGITLCAECGAVSDLVATGGGRLIAEVCVDKEQNLLQPCGRCRQLLYEHGGPDLLILTPEGPTKLEKLLPWAFGPGHLK